MGGKVGNRSKERLAARVVETIKKVGYHADGGGLYLQVSKAGTKSWIYRYTIDKRTREMGLGSLNLVSLKQARERADRYRRLVAERVDPIEHRDAEQQRVQLEQDGRKTFRECAEAFIDSHGAGWKNAKHADQWRNTLRTYTYPVIGDMPVAGVRVSHVSEILEPIWKQKTETASRLRGRIENVLDWATVRGYRSGENPARWRGHLDKLLPRRSAVRKVKHHGALSYEQVGEFLQRLRNVTGISPAALEFVILTAARTSEALGATWSEIDLQERTWSVPEDRMKAGRAHHVPLSTRAVEVLRKLEQLSEGSGLVFPSPLREGRPLSDMTLLVLVKRLAGEQYTTHGFRSSFRDWTAEQTNFPREVAEAALAHTVKDKTEAAYRRGDLFEKRRKMMQAWADYLEMPQAARVLAFKKPQRTS